MGSFQRLLEEPVFREDGIVRVKCKYRSKYLEIDNPLVFNCTTNPNFCPKQLFIIDCKMYILEMDFIQYIKYNNIDTNKKIILDRILL